MSKINIDNPWLSTEELAKVWNVTEQTVRKLVESGQLKAFRIGRQFRIAPDDLQEFLANAATKGNQNEKE